MIIDCHVNMLTAKDYADHLVDTMDEAGIDMCCLLAMRQQDMWGSQSGYNNYVMDAYHKYPNRFIPFASVDLGVDPINMIDNLQLEGFRGIKITRTKYNYNDDIMMPYYERAARYDMVFLFHTGTVVRTEQDRYLDIDSSRLRPIYLDRIARAFPELKLIGAHLGNPWYEEAAMTLFWNPNVYFDLSGTTLKRKSPEWFRDVLWWFPDTMKKLAGNKDTHYQMSHPFDRICFGTDVPLDEIKGCVDEYTKLMDALKLPAEIRERVMGTNVARMFGLMK